MFDPMGAFTKQFTPVEGGYLYYPSKKSGGKLVTPNEFAQLISDWQRIAGRRGHWKSVAAILSVIALSIVISEQLTFPDWLDHIIIISIAVVFSGWILWASFAPRRLVKNRPDVAPPRPTSQAYRETRAALNWRLVIFAILMSGGIFVVHLGSSDRSWAWWGWMLGSGIFLALYLWIAFRKITDSRS